MKPYEEALRRLRHFLEDDHAPGLSVMELMQLPPGFTKVTPGLLRQRGDSDSARQLGALIDEVLSFSPVTDPCKEHIKQVVMLYHKFNLMTERVMEPLAGEDAPFDQSDWAAYERSMFVAAVEAISSMRPGVAAGEIPLMTSWGRECQVRYGEDALVAQALQWLARASK